jgi:hypothetical protein
MDPEEPSESTRKAQPYAWYALGVMTLVYALSFVDRQILSILAEDIRADLDLDDAQLGFLYGTAFAIFYAIFGIPLGRLADNWRRAHLMALGLALWSSMTVLSGLASSFTQLAVARERGTGARPTGHGGRRGSRGRFTRLEGEDQQPRGLATGRRGIRDGVEHGLEGRHDRLHGRRDHRGVRSALLLRGLVRGYR